MKKEITAVCSLGRIGLGSNVRWLLKVFSLLCLPAIVWAVPVISRYDPPTTEPEGLVWIHGTGLRDAPNADVCWGLVGADGAVGSEDRVLGTLGRGSPGIIAWGERVIKLKLPPTLTEGAYWIGVCGRSGVFRPPERVVFTVRGSATAPVVSGYNPTRAVASGRVLIYGRRFGTRQADARIRYGTSLRPEGEASVLRWSDTEIEIQLPSALRNGTYWLAIYRADELLSNLQKSLRVGRSEEMTLRVIRRGTSYVHWSDAASAFYCGTDRRGFAGPSDSTWDNTQVSVGGITRYDPSTPPFPCWTWDHSSYQGAVLFDLSPLIADGRPLPTRVELFFRQEVGPDAPPCGTVFVFAASMDWEAGLQTPPYHPGGVLIGGAGRVGGRLSLPLTDHVRDLVNNARGPEAARRRYYGFLFNDDRTQAEPNSENSRELSITTSPSGCVGRYRDHNLQVSWDPD